MFCGCSVDSLIEGTSWSFKEKRAKRTKYTTQNWCFSVVEVVHPHNSSGGGLAVVLQRGMGRQRRILGQEGPD